MQETQHRLSKTSFEIYMKHCHLRLVDICSCASDIESTYTGGTNSAETNVPVGLPTETKTFFAVSILNGFVYSQKVWFIFTNCLFTQILISPLRKEPSEGRHHHDTIYPTVSTAHTLILSKYTGVNIISSFSCFGIPVGSNR